MTRHYSAQLSIYQASQRHKPEEHRQLGEPAMTHYKQPIIHSSMKMRTLILPVQNVLKQEVAYHHYLSTLF
jgi:hypothetical protein